VPDSRAPGILRADIALQSRLQAKVAGGESFTAKLLVRNTGDTLWLGGGTLRRGGVMLGVKIFDETGKLWAEFHGEPSLPRSVAPGESCEVTIEHSSPREPGRYEVKVDVVDQHICWFEERGSTPLVFPLEVS
jgi:hypothetical protein